LQDIVFAINLLLTDMREIADYAKCCFIVDLRGVIGA